MPKLPPSTAWSRFGLIFLGVGFALILGLLWLTEHLRVPGRVASDRAAKNDHLRSPEVGGLTQNRSSVSADELKKAAEAAAAQQEATAKLSKAIADALALLRDPAIKDKQAALKALQLALRGADPKIAAAAIRAFLATKEDVTTGLRFKVGPNGVLAEAPTMRTFLMDQLGTISLQAGLADAADVARDTLAEKTSADEWAVAMRNVAWADPQGSKAFLADKVREMISYQPWQAQPSGGYLEAFDVAAYSGDASFMTQLAALAFTQSPAAQAARVAMDRLSAMSPDDVATYLNEHPDILADHPLIRADYMGKVDLSDGDQKAQAETYLERTDVSMEEKTKFLARLGLPAGFTTNSLLTGAQGLPSNLFLHREVVNQTATVWLNSGQFPTLQEPLQRLITATSPGG